MNQDAEHKSPILQGAEDVAFQRQSCPLQPRLPTHFDALEAEDNAAWMETIQHTFKSGEEVFVGHYIFVQRGCGGGCLGAAIVDLRDGKLYRPKALTKVLASVNALP